MEPKFHQRTALTWFSPRHPHLASTIMERYHRPLPWPPCDEANKEWARGAPLAQGPNYAHPLCQPDRLRSRTPATLALAPGLGGQGNLVPKGTGASLRCCITKIRPLPASLRSSTSSQHPGRSPSPGTSAPYPRPLYWPRAPPRSQRLKLSHSKSSGILPAFPGLPGLLLTP